MRLLFIAQNEVVDSLSFLSLHPDAFQLLLELLEIYELWILLNLPLLFIVDFASLEWFTWKEVARSTHRAGCGRRCSSNQTTSLFTELLQSQLVLKEFVSRLRLLGQVHIGDVLESCLDNSSTAWCIVGLLLLQPWSFLTRSLWASCWHASRVV